MTQQLQEEYKIIFFDKLVYLLAYLTGVGDVTTELIFFFIKRLRLDETIKFFVSNQQHKNDIFDYNYFLYHKSESSIHLRSDSDMVPTFPD